MSFRMSWIKPDYVTSLMMRVQAEVVPKVIFSHIHSMIHIIHLSIIGASGGITQIWRHTSNGLNIWRITLSS